MKKNNNEYKPISRIERTDKVVFVLLLVLFSYMIVDNTFQTILSYFFGQDKEWATNPSKEARRTYTNILMMSISAFTSWIVRGKLDKNKKIEQSKTDDEENNKCECCGQDVKYE